MNDIVLNPLLMASVPIILGVVSVFKGIGLDAKYAPVLSLVLGLAISFFSGGTSTVSVILGGLIVGLSASGLYSGSKTTVKAITE